MGPSFRLGFAALLGGGATLSFAAAAAAGCTDTSSDVIPEGTFEGGAADAGTCAACNANECLATWSVCLLDPACRAIHACGGTSECVCSPGPSDGAAPPGNAYRAFALCNASRTCGACAVDCASRCAGGGPGPAPSCGDEGEIDAGDDAAPDASAPPSPTADTCATCAASKCNDARRSCGLGTECAAYLECVFECADESCAAACAARHASGRIAAMELATCTTTGCAEACGF